MYVHNLDPVLFSLGPLEIRWYGLVYLLGFVGLYFGLKKLSELNDKQIDSLLVWIIVGMFVGARSFFFLFYRPDLFSVIEFVSVWNGGMSFHGAFIGMSAAGLWWSRRNGQNFWDIADIGALLAGWFLFLGRIANFINAEIPGTAFEGSWCVKYSADDICRHPAVLYAALKDLILGSLMLGLYRKGKFRSGFIFWMFALSYSILRFIVNFFREDLTYAFGWLKMGHILSVGIFIVAVVVLVLYYADDLRKLVKGSQTND